MALYYINEGAFEVPEHDFNDRSVHILESKLDDGTLTISVQRDRFDAGQSLDDLVRTHIEKASRALRGYAILLQRESTAAGVRAIEIGSRWRGDDYMVYTRQAFLPVSTSVWLLVSGNTPITHREACDRAVEHVLETLQLRE